MGESIYLRLPIGLLLQWGVTSSRWQDRNEHNLLQDFDDEIPGYQQNHAIAKTLQDTTLLAGRAHVAINLKTCYQALIDTGVLAVKEMALVDAWLEGIPTEVDPELSRPGIEAK